MGCVQANRAIAASLGTIGRTWLARTAEYGDAFAKNKLTKLVEEEKGPGGWAFDRYWPKRLLKKSCR